MQKICTLLKSFVENEHTTLTIIEERVCACLVRFPSRLAMTSDVEAMVHTRKDMTPLTACLALQRKQSDTLPSVAHNIIVYDS